METVKKFLNALLELFMKFANLKAIVAIKDGFILTLPLTMVGSLFLLLSNFPITGYGEFMLAHFGENWNLALNKVSGATFDVLGLVSAIGIAYKYATSEKCDGITAGILAMVSYLILTPDTVLSDGGEVVSSVIPKSWVGANGVILAILVGLLVGCAYCFFVNHKITIKMPPSVPDGVSRAFSALIPGAAVFLVSAVIYTVCELSLGMSVSELVFSIIQIPLQNVSDTLAGEILLIIIMNVLFWCGIHGPNIVGGVMNPVYTANALANQAVLDAGGLLVAGTTAKIITIQFTDVFIKIGGSGCTLGLMIAIFIACKSQQLKSISKLAIIPSLFNVNEPVIFGLPIVFNSYLLLPFVLGPICAAVITYGSIAIGFMQPFSGVQIPWATPPIISGYLLGGIPGIVVQALIITVNTLIYLPFIKAQDKILVKEEAENTQKA